MFRFQAQVAERVTQAMDVALLQREKQALVALPTQNQEAYDAFLRADAIFLRQDGPEDIREATTLYETAVALDSTFDAVVLSQLGGVLSIRGRFEEAA